MEICWWQLILEFKALINIFGHIAIALILFELLTQRAANEMNLYIFLRETVVIGFLCTRNTKSHFK